MARVTNKHGHNGNEYLGIPACKNEIAQKVILIIADATEPANRVFEIFIFFNEIRINGRIKIIEFRIKTVIKIILKAQTKK